MFKFSPHTPNPIPYTLALCLAVLFSCSNYERYPELEREQSGKKHSSSSVETDNYPSSSSNVNSQSSSSSDVSAGSTSSSSEETNTDSSSSNDGVSSSSVEANDNSSSVGDVEQSSNGDIGSSSSECVGEYCISPSSSSEAYSSSSEETQSSSSETPSSSSEAKCVGTPPSSMFCYDGTFQSKCGGETEYDLSTEICLPNGVVIPAKCPSPNGTPYNPLTQKCDDDGIVKDRCGTDGDYYDPATEQCCGNSKYVTETQFCSGYDNKVFSKCGSLEFNPENQRCNSSGIVETRCGTGNNWYDPATQNCNIGFEGTMTDDCDNTYKTVGIGTQIWMAENMNCNTVGGKCYADNGANCTKYGMLYDWETAGTVCPSGWHLPDTTEWNILSSFVKEEIGCSNVNCVGEHLITTSGWDDNVYGSTNGLDTYGFAALPGGYSTISPGFSDVGKHGYWWSASENRFSAGKAYCYEIYKNGFIKPSNDKRYLYSVRCVKDD